MAFEIKTMDVANEAEAYFIELYGTFGWRLKSSQRVFNRTSRPVATIGNGSVNYVHTQTETVDFTKLVFERDTSMENYERLYSLESQYFALQGMMPEKEPAITSDVPFEKWAERYGELSNWKVTVVTLIISAIACMIGIVFVSTPMSEIPQMLESLKTEPVVIFGLLFASLFLGGITSYLLSLFVYSPLTKKKALKNPSSKGYAKLQQEYNKVHAEAVSYEENKARMILILAEAAKLVK